MLDYISGSFEIASLDGSKSVALDKMLHRKFKAKGKQYRIVEFSMVSKCAGGTRQVLEMRNVIFHESNWVEVDSRVKACSCRT